MIFFAGLGSSPRLEIPTGRANRSKTMRTAGALSYRALHSESVREAGLNTYSERDREGVNGSWSNFCEVKLLHSFLCTCSYRLAIRKLILPLPRPFFPAQGNHRTVLQLIIALGAKRLLPYPTLQCFLIELGLLWAPTEQLMDCSPDQGIIFEGTSLCNRTQHGVIGDKPRNMKRRKQEIRNPWGRCIRFILLSFCSGDKVFVFFKTQRGPLRGGL